MSDTPLTDAEEGEATFTESGCAADVVNADFARDLERRLQAALHEVEEHKSRCTVLEAEVAEWKSQFAAALAEKGKP